MNRNLAAAARPVIPFDALQVKVAGVVRHPESHSAEITLLLQSKDIEWQPTGNRKTSANITLAADSLTRAQDALASRSERLILSAPTQDPAHLARLVTRLQLTIAVPPTTQSIREVTEAANGGRIGAVDLDRKTIDAAPSMPSPIPHLLCREPCRAAPSIHQ